MISSTDVLIERSRHLIDISRYEEAIKNLKEVLSAEPNHFEANLLLAICFYEGDKYHEAFEYTNRLIGLAPDVPVVFYYHALNYAGIRDFSSAEKYVWEALKLDPDDADFWALLSWLYIYKNDWARALEYAEKGLSSNPEHIQCLNHKSTCLIKLNKVDELEVNLEDTLAQDPTNYYSHANAGWVQLEKGNHIKAKEHFLESLRLRPGNEVARNGVIQSLKARNWFFRVFLAYYFWIARHKEYTQWAIVIGVYVGGRVLRSLSQSFPFLWPVYILLCVLVYLSWIINPLFNLFLFMDPLGKHVLNEEEKKGATFVGAGLLLAIGCLGLWIATDLENWLFSALFFATTLIPISHYFELGAYQPKKRIGWLTLALLCLGACGLIMIWLGAEVGFVLISIYFLGIWGYGWLANYLASK